MKQLRETECDSLPIHQIRAMPLIRSELVQWENAGALEMEVRVLRPTFFSKKRRISPERENMPEYFNFGMALTMLKAGKKVCRAGWNGKGIFIELQNPDENSKMSHPYIYIDTTGLRTDNEHAPKSLVPWLASQTDMLSDDWLIA